MTTSFFFPSQPQNLGALAAPDFLIIAFAKSADKTDRPRSMSFQFSEGR
jgi:hypothetical protein